MKITFLSIQTSLAIAAGSAIGQGTLIYDQQSSTTNGAGAGSGPIQSLEPMGQSFTPVLPAVGFVQLEFLDFTPGNGVGATVYVNLLSGSITGAVLSSTAPVSMPDGVDHSVSTFFFPSAVPVTPGTSYYLQPVVQSGDNPWNIVADFFNYSGGTWYVNGQPNPDGLDLWFREGVVPEPSTWALALVATAAICCRRKKSAAK